MVTLLFFFLSSASAEVGVWGPGQTGSCQPGLDTAASLLRRGVSSLDSWLSCPCFIFWILDSLGYHQRLPLSKKNVSVPSQGPSLLCRGSVPLCWRILVQSRMVGSWAWLSQGVFLPLKPISSPDPPKGEMRGHESWGSVEAPGL